MNKRELARALRALAEMVDQLDDEAMGALLGTRASYLSDVIRPASKRQRRGPKAPPMDPGKARLLLDELRGLNSRDAGAALIAERCPNRRALEVLARAADVPVQRSDTVGMLADRIVEATIGYRLRSEAVQGRAPDRSPPEATHQ